MANLQDAKVEMISKYKIACEERHTQDEKHCACPKLYIMFTLNFSR